MSFVKIVRNILVSIIVMGGLLVGGGFAYTYYLGPDGEQTAAVQQPVATQPQPITKPSQQNPNANASASITVLSSPVAPGTNASISVRTNQLAKCKISVVYAGVASKDSGLAPKTADEFGTVSWAWTVEASVPEGKHPVKVECANAANTKTAVVQSEQVVSKQPEAGVTTP